MYQCDSDDKGDGIGQEDENGGKIIISRTEYGQMVDFLKANPYVTRDEYMWQWTIPQIRLASYDFTHIDYDYDKKKKVKVINSAEDLLNDMNIPKIHK